MTDDGEVRTYSRTGADGEHIVAVSGQIDLATAPAFRRVLDEAAADRRQLTLDLAALDFLDSAGIKVLFDLAARLDLHLIVDPHSLIASTLGISGLAAATTIRSCAAPSR